MRIAPRATGLILALFTAALMAQTTTQKITVTGKLVRVMAIGAESTGWSLEFNSPTAIDVKVVNSIQVRSRDTAKLEKLANQQVRVTGTLAYLRGVESGEQVVIDISTIKKSKATSQPNPPVHASFGLLIGEWLLEDLGGDAILDNTQASLSFPEEGKVSGNGSCNRFFGSVETTGDAIKFGALAASRMACPEAVMNQESKYLQALQAAERFEWKDPYLLIYTKGLEKPLRFTRKPAAPPAS